MIRLLCLAVFSLLPSMVVAQATLVRTGLHDEFTRMVVDFPPGTEWSLEQTGRVIRLTSDQQTGFDLGDVYRRIPRSRIDRIEQTGTGELTVRLGCACLGDASQLPNGHVMLDIRRAEAPAPVSYPAPGLRVPVSGPALPLLPGRLTQAVTSAPPGDGPRMPSPSERSDDLRAALRDQISRRMAQGLVEGQPPEIATAPDPEPLGSDPPQLASGSNLSVSQGNDVADRVAPPIPPNVSCPAFTRGTFADWPIPGDENTSGYQPLVVDALGLLADGLGAEARALIAARDTETGELALLAQIAQVMDAPVPAPLVEQAQSCGPVAELFALIADPPAVPSNPDLLLATVESARPAVARHLRTRAIDALKSLGLSEDARILANTRTSDETPVRDLDIAILQAAIDPPSAEDLMGVVRLRTPEAAEAMTRLLNGLLEDDGTVPSDIIDQAGALARQTPPADRLPLERAIVASLIAGDNYSAAANRIDTVTGRVDQPLPDLYAMFFSSILAEPDPARFVRLAARFFERLPPDSPQGQAMAERVFETGLPVLATQILDRNTGPPTRSGRILRARIDVEARRPLDADRHLAGLTGADVDALRAQIAQLPQPEPAVSPPTAADPGIRERHAETIRRGSELRAELEALLSQ